MLTDPHAGEFRCRGPVHKTASKAIAPSHATRVNAHSGLIRRAICLPLCAYHSSGSSVNDSVRAFWLRLFQDVATPEPGEDSPDAGLDPELPREGADTESLGPNTYNPFSRGVPGGLDSRHAYCKACRSFRSFRFTALRIDRIRTENEGSIRISWISSAVTESPSRQRIWTSRRMSARRRLEKMPRNGPEQNLLVVRVVSGS